MSPEDLRARDEADLRWYWNDAEGELGASGSADFERAAASVLPRPERCACQTCPPLGRRRARAGCPECRGLGVVAPTTYPRGAQASAAAEEVVWLALFRSQGGDPLISAREPAWMALVGPAALRRRRHRAIRLALVEMRSGHVHVLHAVYGPAPRPPGAEAPPVVLVLAAMNRQLPERDREPILQRLRAGRVDRFKDGSARRHADTLIAASWRAYGRARGRVLDEEREHAVSDLREMRAELVEAVAVLGSAPNMPATTVLEG